MSCQLSRAVNTRIGSETSLLRQRRINEHLPDIAIVDLGLPDEDGLSLIRRWRSNDVSLPILVLTARESWQDKVEVLSAGADDYVTDRPRQAIRDR
ncbi:response regulator, partial [Escherichia sp. TWPC-MK]